MRDDDARGVALFRFRPVAAGIDPLLRDRVVPELRARPGIIDVYLGRQGPDELGPRIVASVWDHAQSGDARAPAPVDALRPPFLDDVPECDLVAAPVTFGFRFMPTEAAGILRVVEGTVRSGELETYLAEAREGTQRDAESGRGPLALYLAAMPPDAFLTLSVWTDWTTLEAATGGDPRRPVATRHEERLAAWTATHYEVVPATAGAVGARASTAG